MSGPPPWTTTGLSPTYLSSTTSRANSSRSAASSIAAPPYLITTVRPWNSRMYGSASSSVATSRAGAMAPFCLQRQPGGGLVPPPPGPRLPLRTLRRLCLGARIELQRLPARDRQLRAADDLAVALTRQRVGLGRARRDRAGRAVAADLRRPRPDDGGEVRHAQHVRAGRGRVAGQDDLLGRPGLVARGADGGQRAVGVL